MVVRIRTRILTVLCKTHKTLSKITQESGYKRQQDKGIYKNRELGEQDKMEKAPKGNTSNNAKNRETRQKASYSQHLVGEKKQRKRKWKEDTKSPSSVAPDSGRMPLRPYTWFLALPSKK